jgi:predicted HicB family RNase H-like nuclease
MASRGRPRQYREDRVTTAVRLPEALHRRLTEEAEARDTSLNHLLVRAATYYLDHMLPPLGPVEHRGSNGTS